MKPASKNRESARITIGGIDGWISLIDSRNWVNLLTIAWNWLHCIEVDLIGMLDSNGMNDAIHLNWVA